jgi:hypothetical protein
MIDGRFNTPIFVQTPTSSWGGATTWSDRAGQNLGYLRVLSQRERASTDKPTLFSTHRAVMTCSVVPIYGERLRIGSSYYIVKGIDAHELSGGNFQTVDCEVVT